MNTLRRLDKRLDGHDTRSSRSVLPMEQRRKHPDLWYDDGNVVLTTPTTVFCVYRGILSKHSPFFRDLFSLQQHMEAEHLNSDLGESFQGKPVIDMHDDAEDLAHFLKALHDFGNLVEYNGTEHYPPALLKAILRLSVKYDVEFLRKRLLVYLRNRYWVSRREFTSPLRNSGAVEILPGDLVRFAQGVHIPVLLPSAFYEAALLSSSDLDFIDNNPSMSEGYNVLSKEDWTTIHRGRDKLQTALDRHVFKHLAYIGSSRGCTDPESCRHSRMEFVDKFYAGWIQRPDVLAITSNKARWVSTLRGLCPECAELLERSLLESHSQVWKETPGYFRLPSWQTLRKDSCLSSDEESD